MYQLSADEYRELVDLLAKNPNLVIPASRVTLLNEADLGRFIPQLDFQVGPQIFAGSLVTRLQQFGAEQLPNGTLRPVLAKLLKHILKDYGDGSSEYAMILGLLEKVHPTWRNDPVSQAAGGAGGGGSAPRYPLSEIRVLFLESNPLDTTRLDLAGEIKKIVEELKMAPQGSKFKFNFSLAVEAEDLSRLLFEFDPHIIHFSGHGDRDGRILLRDAIDKALAVPIEGLVDTFKLATQLRGVVLNACYTEPQASALRDVADFVVGMDKAIGDRAAQQFSVGFYRALAFGRGITVALQAAQAQIKTTGYSGSTTPQMKLKDDFDAVNTVLVR